MKCEKCSYEFSDEFDFCPKCGQKKVNEGKKVYIPTKLTVTSPNLLYKYKITKKKIAIISILLVLVLAGSGFGYYKYLEHQKELEDQEIEENWQITADATRRNFVLDCAVFELTLKIDSFLKSSYTDGLMEAWDKGLSGDINVAIKNYQEEESHKKLMDVMDQNKQRLDTLYDNYIKTTDTVYLEDDSDLTDLRNYIDEAYENHATLHNIVKDVTGSYLSYNNERIEALRKNNLSLENIIRKTKQLRETYGITDDEVNERMKLVYADFL